MGDAQTHKTTINKSQLCLKYAKYALPCSGQCKPKCSNPSLERVCADSVEAVRKRLTELMTFLQKHEQKTFEPDEVEIVFALLDEMTEDYLRVSRSRKERRGTLEETLAASKAFCERIEQRLGRITHPNWINVETAIGRTFLWEADVTLMRTVGELDAFICSVKGDDEFHLLLAKMIVGLEAWISGIESQYSHAN